ncbi:MAG: 3-hydroxyacyl-CoA dehydrogenase family protein [Promethearchaeota archaeon]
MVEKINTISVIGAGYMGRQIIKKSAMFNYDVKVFDTNLEGLKQYIEEIKEKEDIKREITLYDDLSEAVKNTDLVIEAIPEILELKRDVFSQIDKVAPPHAIIATNSSSIPISKLEAVVKRRDKVMNIHFYHLFDYPMADLMKGTQTSDETFEKGKKWVESIDITPLIVKKECYGFVFNRVWRAIKKDCLKIWGDGYADFKDVDKAFKIFTSKSKGPFEFMDEIGLDVIYDIEMSYFKKSGDPDDKPPQALKDKVDRGELGKKSGKGFYNWK